MEKQLKITHKGNTIQIESPYNPKFRDKMIELDGIWDKPNQCWWLNVKKIQAVREAMKAVFGAADVEERSLRSLKLTFVESDGAYKTDYILFGKVLSHATSLTSGGIAGADVTYLSGQPESGGSVKNWCSVIPAGSVIRLDNVKEQLIESQKLPSCVRVDYIIPDEKLDRAALEKEKSELTGKIRQLQTRLARVEQLLKEAE